MSGITPEDLKFSKEMTKLEWALTRNILLPAGYTSCDEQILAAVSCEFAQKCVLDLIGRLKPELSRLKLEPSASESVVDEQVKAGNMACFNDSHRLNLVRQVRSSVMILGAGWKATESLYITYIEVQGMSLRKVIDHLVRSKANWEDVNHIMLLPDAMCMFDRVLFEAQSAGFYRLGVSGSWRGNFQALTDLVSIIRQRCPNAIVYLCGIPIYDPTKIEAWQLHWIKLFNQYMFKLCASSPSRSIQVFYMGKFVKEHKNDWQPGKPYYPKPETSGSIVAALTRVFEMISTKNK